MNISQNEKIVMKVSRVSIIGNLVISIIKLIAGIFAHSTAMISDSVHSASDIFSTVVVIIGFKLSSKKADKEHPYGHERIECIASIILAFVLFVTGIEIGKSAVQILLSNDAQNIVIPGSSALFIAIVSIIIKELMYQYTIINANRIKSSSLKADAWHHRSDALSSVGAAIGIAGSRMGFVFMEQWACLIICLFIVKAAFDIFKDAVDKLIDKSCDEEIEQRMKDLIINEPGIENLVSLNTRMFASKVYVDAVISVNRNLPLVDAHDISERVHDDIENNFPEVKHCMVHFEPTEE